MNSLHLQAAWEFLQNYSTIFVACSGGVDSIVLVDLLHKANLDVHVLHCNYQLRGMESDKDEEFVKSFCVTRNIPFESISFDTKNEQKKRNKTTQETARELRYEWFEAHLSKNPNSIVCTAHHKDDNREQFLLKLISSGKLSDLSGIQLSRSGYYRPLLHFPKAELIQYAEKSQLKWRDDQSNSENEYMRNKIRNLLLPIMIEVDKRTEKGLDRVLSEVNLLKSEINAQIDTLFKNSHNSNEFFVTNDFWEDQLTLFKELFLAKWMKSGILQSDIEQIFKNAKPGSFVEHGNYYVMKEKDGLWFGQHSLDSFPETNLDSSLHLTFSNLKISVDQKGKDSKKWISIPLNKNEITTYSIRPIQAGDVVYSPAIQQNRLVKKIMNDWKKKHFERKKQLLLIHKKNPIQLIGSKVISHPSISIDKNNNEILFLNILIKKVAVIKK